MKTFKLLLVSSVLLLFSCNVLDVTLESESFPVTGGVRSNTTTVFNDKIWTMIFGLSGDIEQRLWATDNGINWYLHEENPFRSTFKYTEALFSHDELLWAITATPAADIRNEIWNSPDGLSWRLIARGSQIPFESDNVQFATVFNDKMVVFTKENGAFGPSFEGTRIYSSTDGVNWTLDTNVTIMNSDRLTVSVFNDQIYLIGSRPPSTPSGISSEREMWRSPDCISWSIVTYPRGAYVFPALMDHSSVAYDDHLFVIGGTSSVFSGLSDDIWYTNDALEWRKYSGNTPFNGVKEHTTVNFNGKIWLFGGRMVYRDSGSIGTRRNTEVWSIVFNDD